MAVPIPSSALTLGFRERLIVSEMTDQCIPPPGTLTIRAMVRVGPWTVRQVHYQQTVTNCERCDARIKEIWECEVDLDSPRLSELGGKSVWLIGSTCGPTLMMVSEATWKVCERPLKGQLRLAIRTQRVINAARDQGYPDLPDFVEERFPLILAGTLEERSRKHLGMVVTTHGRWLKLWK